MLFFCDFYSGGESSQVKQVPANIAALACSTVLTWDTVDIWTGPAGTERFRWWCGGLFSRLLPLLPLQIFLSVLRSAALMLLFS